MMVVLKEDLDGIRFLILNRPGKLNSLTVGVFKALLAEVETNDRPRFCTSHQLPSFQAGTARYGQRAERECQCLKTTPSKFVTMYPPTK